MESEYLITNGRFGRVEIERDPRMVDLAQETLQILENGQYYNKLGQEVTLANEQEYAVCNTRLYTPEKGTDLLTEEHVARDPFPATIRVTNETTQAAARRLVLDEEQTDLAILNFASAKKPGGGFLNGAPAQEESISRCSGLYPILLTQPDYYHMNKARKSGLYTDHIIYSPDVPWFRDENYALLDNIYLASVITAPAPNAGSLRKREKKQVESRLRERAGKVLAVAEAEGHRSLLLGAWGCGVFKNDPAMVADAFGAWLASDRFTGSFDHVTFAVLDNTQGKNTIRSFEDRFRS